MVINCMDSNPVHNFELFIQYNSITLIRTSGVHCYYTHRCKPLTISQVF